MPNRCCVPGCRSGYEGSKKTSSSARNGSGPYRCKKAVIINFESKYTRVCANYFDASDIITAYDFNINGDSVSQKRDKPTLKADTVPRIFEGLPSYLTKRKPRSRSSTVQPPHGHHANDHGTIRAISTRTYGSLEELLCCLKRLEERVGTVGSRDIKHSRASEIQNLTSHGNKENRAAETALNESQQNQQN
ncbi:hypothetical protein HPB52_009245 [Rhipicephalus sanguineus]|uniref:THAP-type domain-containing protein n=1 Tax=Rhipicephalus sanguineus TaxID=34632 RepID=A0A9D4PIT8_RHISA|nr:hypothetical protein HPB52_009245 [Rhipicephalus sanguineus]